jgi:prepilin-type N-terminal cleavage/methylation domain-containing protein
MAPLRFRRRWDEGFTVSELLVVLALIGFILSISWMLMQTASQYASFSEANSEASDEARQALDRMTMELRQAQEATDRAGFCTTMTARSIGFYTDTKHDGRLDRVTYFMSGNSLTRRETSATTPAPPYVFKLPEAAPTTVVKMVDPTWSGAIFGYVTDDGTTATVAADVSAVSIRIKDSMRSGKVTATIDVNTLVKIRSVWNSLD